MYNPFLYVNISIEFFGTLTSLIILICLMFGANRNDSLNIKYMRMLLCNILVPVSDAFAGIFKGIDIPLAFVIVRAANFLVFSVSYAFAPLFTDYMTAFIGEKVKISKRIVYIMYAMCGFAVLLVIVSHFCIWACAFVYSNDGFPHVNLCRYSDAAGMEVKTKGTGAHQRTHIRHDFANPAPLHVQHAYVNHRSLRQKPAGAKGAAYLFGISAR